MRMVRAIVDSCGLIAARRLITRIVPDWCRRCQLSTDGGDLRCRRRTVRGTSARRAPWPPRRCGRTLAIRARAPRRRDAWRTDDHRAAKATEAACHAMQAATMI